MSFPDYMRRGEASITRVVTFRGGGDTGKVYESFGNVHVVRQNRFTIQAKNRSAKIIQYPCLCISGRMEKRQRR